MSLVKMACVRWVYEKPTGPLPSPFSTTRTDRLRARYTVWLNPDAVESVGPIGDGLSGTRIILAGGTQHDTDLTADQVAERIVDGWT